MKLIDLTMPIWEGAGYGEILPFTNSPVRLHEYMYYDKHGLRMTRMKLTARPAVRSWSRTSATPSIRHRCSPTQNFHGCSMKYRSKN